jgi:hypothetical protein
MEAVLESGVTTSETGPPKIRHAAKVVMSEGAQYDTAFCTGIDSTRK